MSREFPTPFPEVFHGLSLPIEKHHVMGVALPIIVRILAAAVGAFAGIDEQWPALVIKHKRAAVSVGVIPCDARLYRQKCGIVGPRIAQGGPSNRRIPNGRWQVIARYSRNVVDIKKSDGIDRL